MRSPDAASYTITFTKWNLEITLSCDIMGIMGDGSNSVITTGHLWLYLSVSQRIGLFLLRTWYVIGKLIKCDTKANALPQPGSQIH